MVGSINADLTVRVERIPSPGETVGGSDLERLPGGKSANQATAAARLGADVQLVGAVGDDDAGTAMLSGLRASGVDVAAVRRIPGTPTGHAIIVVDDAGENSIVLSPGANRHVLPTALDPVAFDGCGWACFALEVPVETVRAGIDMAQGSGARVVLNPSPTRMCTDDLVRGVDVLIVNEHEAREVLHLSPELRLDPADPGLGVALAASARALEVAHVVVTRGGEGALVLDVTDGALTEVPPVQTEVVDTTGCGDAFTGALVAHLANGVSMAAAATAAGTVGAYAAHLLGAQTSYPTAAELAAWLEARV